MVACGNLTNPLEDCILVHLLDTQHCVQAQQLDVTPNLDHNTLKFAHMVILKLCLHYCPFPLRPSLPFLSHRLPYNTVFWSSSLLEQYFRLSWLLITRLALFSCTMFRFGWECLYLFAIRFGDSWQDWAVINVFWHVDVANGNAWLDIENFADFSPQIMVDWLRYKKQFVYGKLPTIRDSSPS